MIIFFNRTLERFICLLLIVLAVSNSYGQYCSPDVQMACFYGDKIVNVTFAGINHDDDVCTQDSEGKKDFRTTVAAAQVTAGSSYNLSVGVENNFSTGTERVRAWIDFNHDYVFAAGESFDLGIGTGNTTLSATIAIPSDTYVGTTAMRVMYRRTSTNPLNAEDACHSYGSYRGQMKDYAVTINSSVSCTSALNPGNTISTLSAACPNESFTLSLQNTVVGPTYQWQKSVDGDNWSNISGETNNTVTTSQISAFYYRCEVECDGNFGYSNAILISSNGPVYVPLPIQESFESWLNTCGNTTNVPANFWDNSPATGDNSFRREDQGASAGWLLAGNGLFTPVSSHGQHSARFHTYNTGTNLQGNLSLFIDCSSGSTTKSLSFDYINLSGQDVLTPYISIDGGLNFVAMGPALTTNSGWTQQVFHFASSSATTIIRFTATSDYQLSDIGLDNVRVQTNVICSEPINVSVSNLTTTGAIVSWNAPTAVPLNGYEYVLSTQNVEPTGTGTSILSLSKQFYNLTPNTTYYFFVRSSCENGTFSDWELFSFTTLQSNVGVEENNAIQLTVSPNPAKNEITIESVSGVFMENVQILNLSGKILFETLFQPTSSAVISLQEIPNGVYFVNVSSNLGWKNNRLVILK